MYHWKVFLDSQKPCLFASLTLLRLPPRRTVKRRHFSRQGVLV